MFEFFLALFGGAYYGTKIAYDKALLKTANQRSQERIAWHTARQIVWAERVCDRALEEDLTRFIADPRNYEAVWREVKDAYAHMPSYKAFTRILLHDSMIVRSYGKGKYSKKQRDNMVASSRESALDIMLARRGKVRNPQVSYLDNILLVKPGEGQHTMEKWERGFEFIVYLRDALRENGIDARPIFMTGLSGSEHESIAYDVGSVDQFRYKAGRFVWLPVTYYDDNLHYAQSNK